MRFSTSRTITVDGSQIRTTAPGQMPEVCVVTGRQELLVSRTVDLTTQTYSAFWIAVVALPWLMTVGIPGPIMWIIVVWQPLVARAYASRYRVRYFIDETTLNRRLFGARISLVGMVGLCACCWWTRNKLVGSIMLLPLGLTTLALLLTFRWLWFGPVRLVWAGPRSRIVLRGFGPAFLNYCESAAENSGSAEMHSIESAFPDSIQFPAPDSPDRNPELPGRLKVDHNQQ